MTFLRKLFRKLFPEKSQIDFPGGYIPHRFFLEKIKEGPVLVVGDFTGRDYPAVKAKVGEAYMVDVADNHIASGKYFVRQSIEKPLPFPHKFFKAILMTEVLEHVWEDKKALEELRKVLADDGLLLLSVPFWSDFHVGEGGHYHIYSPITIDLVIEHAGYEILERNYRGLIVSIPYPIVALIALLMRPFWGRRSLQRTNEMLYRVHCALGSHVRLNTGFAPGFFLRKSGVNIVARKSAVIPDALKSQTEYFERADPLTMNS